MIIVMFIFIRVLITYLCFKDVRNTHAEIKEKTNKKQTNKQTNKLEEYGFSLKMKTVRDIFKLDDCEKIL